MLCLARMYALHSPKNAMSAPTARVTVALFLRENNCRMCGLCASSADQRLRLPSGGPSASTNARMALKAAKSADVQASFPAFHED